jgi:hypothetical protein
MAWSPTLISIDAFSTAGDTLPDTTIPLLILKSLPLTQGAVFSSFSYLSALGSFLVLKASKMIRGFSD